MRELKDEEADASGGHTRQVAEYAVSLTYEMLPDALVDLTKQCILDIIGVMIGATTLAPEAALLHQYALGIGGNAQSTVFGFGSRLPAQLAVFVNGSLGHMLDYDDVGGGGHASVATIPPALALAEQLGTVSGRDLITAVAAGMDVQTRLNAAVDEVDWAMSDGWFATQLFGSISGTIAAAKLLRLDADQMENAIGIGFNQMSGSRQMAVGAATDMRSMQAGFSGQAAVIAAGLAKAGLSGPKQAFEGRFGIFRNYIRAPATLSRITDGLSKDFPILKSHGFKVWPACGYTRPTNTAIRHLREQHGLKPDDVEAITIIGGSGGTRLLSEPILAKRRPKSSIDGKYSIPFTSAVMMARGNVKLGDFTDEGLQQPEVLAMADRVSWREGGQDANKGKMPMPVIEIRTRSGEVFSHQPTSVPGDAKNPASWDMLTEKFLDCLSYSHLPVDERTGKQAIDRIRNLEAEKSVGELIRLLHRQ